MKFGLTTDQHNNLIAEIKLVIIKCNNSPTLLAKKLGISRAAVHLWMKKNKKYPQPIHPEHIKILDEIMGGKLNKFRLNPWLF